jgi:hypothetical protein
MVYDCEWPVETPFEEAIGPLGLKESKIAPFCMLRTCKSNVCVGLAVGQYQILNNADEQWMVNGKFGIIQFRK